jgi:hypothetical protein
MCEGKIKGAEASDAFLRKDLRVVISGFSCALINYWIRNEVNGEKSTKNFNDFPPRSILRNKFLCNFIYRSSKRISSASFHNCSIA